MSKNKVYRKSDDFVYRKIGNETILVPIKKAITRLRSIYTLNETGCRIWERLNGKRTVTELAGLMVEEYDVLAETAATDIEAYLGQLEALGAVGCCGQTEGPEKKSKVRA